MRQSQNVRQKSVAAPSAKVWIVILPTCAKRIAKTDEPAFLHSSRLTPASTSRRFFFNYLTLTFFFRSLFLLYKYSFNIFFMQSFILSISFFKPSFNYSVRFSCNSLLLVSIVTKVLIEFYNTGIRFVLSYNIIALNSFYVSFTKNAIWYVVLQQNLAK